MTFNIKNKNNSKLIRLLYQKYKRHYNIIVDPNKATIDEELDGLLNVSLCSTDRYLMMSTIRQSEGLQIEQVRKI